jgi:hypothetical protein
MWRVSCLDLVVVDIEARPLNPESLEAPVPHLAAAAARFQDGEEDANACDNVADPARKLIVHSGVFSQIKNPPTKDGSVKAAIGLLNKTKPAERRAQFSSVHI